MTIKSSQILVEEALKEVKTITAEEALSLSNENKCNLIDIRDGIELQRLGTIENSYHISRGLLEFSLHPQSPYIQKENLYLNMVHIFSIVENFPCRLFALPGLLIQF